MRNKKLLISLIIVILVVAAAIWYLPKLKKIVWDGNYKMTGSLTCTGDIPNLSTVPMDTTIVVVGNKIVDQQTSKIFDIDKKGKVTEAIQISDKGVDTNVSADYQFYQENKVNKFSATGSVVVSLSKNDQKLSSTCTGTMTGVKE